MVRYPHLALSGGGFRGAFGAGFLKGWSRTGQRPVFKMVTGVSTGALMAPFAFLGPEYDEMLGEFYKSTGMRPGWF
jgi:predicted acylesterase/phospholipase RssA